MRGTQGGLATDALVLHMQHDYLAVRGGKDASVSSL
jgi:hypothetical protein